MSWNNGNVEQNNNGDEKKAYVATVEEAHAPNQQGKFSEIHDKLELASLKGDEQAKANLTLLDKLPELAQDIFNKVQESGNNQNVRYTAKLVSADQIGKDGTVYAKAGDLEMSIKVQTAKDRSMNIAVDIADGELKAGYIKVEDKALSHEVAKKDGSGTFPVYDKIEFKDFSDREKAIFKAIADKGGEQEKTDWKPAFAVKRELMDALKAEGVDAYVAVDKNKPREYTTSDGEKKTGYDERISFAKVNDVDVVLFTVQSTKDGKEGMERLENPIEIALSADGEVQAVNKVEFEQTADGKFKPVKTPVEASDVPKGFASAMDKITGGAEQTVEQAQTFTKSDVAVEKAQPVKAQEGRNF